MSKPRCTFLPVLALAVAALQPTLRAGQTVLPPNRTYGVPEAVANGGVPTFGTYKPMISTAAATTGLPTFSQIIVFGDSLSDVGNDADLTADSAIGVRFPGPDAATLLNDSAYSYTDGRFTDGDDSDPSTTLYSGVWHEQLAKLFLDMTPAKASLDKGLDYAYGGAVSGMGQGTESAGDGTISIKVDNVGRQVATYIDAHPAADPAALYIVWSGANDLFADDSATAISAAATNNTSYVQRLAEAGATTFIVPNLPPLGATPEHNTDATLTPAAASYRDLLNSDLDTLENTLAAEGLTVTIYRLDVFGLFQRLIANQESYGFTDITHSSQGGSDPDHHLFWDGVHPTTAGHFQLACEAYSVLTGVPVVEVNPKSDKTGFYLTRTGPDTTTKIKVNYALGGSTTDGTAIPSVQGVKKIKPGQQTVEFDVTPATGQFIETLKVKAGDHYVLPVVKKGKIKFN